MYVWISAEPQSLDSISVTSVTTTTITVVMGQAAPDSGSYTLTTSEITDPSTPDKTEADIHTTSTTVMNLKPGRRYTLTVVVVVNGGVSDPVSVTDNTR